MARSPQTTDRATPWECVGDPEGSQAAGECFSDASIANTIRADDREVGDRAKGRYIL